MMADDGHKPHGFRPALCHCQHIDAEGVLQSCFFVKHVAEIFHICALFQIQYNTDALFGGLVGNIHNIVGFPCLCQIVHIHQEFPDIGPYHGVGNFRNHQPLPAAFYLFNLHFSPDFDFSGACLINMQQI